MHLCTGDYLTHDLCQRPVSRRRRCRHPVPEGGLFSLSSHPSIRYWRH